MNGPLYPGCLQINVAGVIRMLGIEKVNGVESLLLEVDLTRQGEYPFSEINIVELGSNYQPQGIYIGVVDGTYAIFDNSGFHDIEVVEKEIVKA